jgi:hypothetical protein
MIPSGAHGTLGLPHNPTRAPVALLSQFHRVEQLSPAKKALVKEFLDAFLFKDHVKGQLA